MMEAVVTKLIASLGLLVLALAATGAG